MAVFAAYNFIIVVLVYDVLPTRMVVLVYCRRMFGQGTKLSAAAFD